MKPLSPQLQPSDLRTIAGLTQIEVPNLDNVGISCSSISETQSHSSVAGLSLQGSTDMMVQAQQLSILQDERNSGDEWFHSHPSSPGSPSSSSGSRCGFYSFVDDLTSPEAELNEAWMVSPQRQTQLEILKEEKGFKLQTYANSRKPQSLFSESNGDSQYKVVLNDGFHMVQDKEEKQLRTDIIRNQAPKKKPSFEDQHSVLENIDQSRATNKMIEGFSLSYSPVSSRPKWFHPSEPGNIDKEPINFSAARKQFLKMEQEQLTAPLNPLSFSKTHQNITKDPAPEEMYHNMDISKEPLEDETSPDWIVTVFKTDESLNQQSSVFDDLDSGLEELPIEVDGTHTCDELIFNDNSQEDKNCKLASDYETPIEREIRLIQEREMNLRRSRGLRHSENTAEMVEIKIKRLQSPLTPIKVKEKNQVSFVIQHDVQNENQKNEKPQQKLLEHYSLQPTQRLEAKNKDFEHKDQDQRKAGRLQSESGDTIDFPSPCCPHRHSEETEFDLSHRKSVPPSSLNVQDTQPLNDMNLVTSRSWRENLLSSGLQSRRQGAPDFIEKEIEEALKREDELRKLRVYKKSSEPPVVSPAPQMEKAKKMAVSQFDSTASAGR